MSYNLYEAGEIWSSVEYGSCKLRTKSFVEVTVVMELLLKIEELEAHIMNDTQDRGLT